MKLVVGLGNPGEKYKRVRHNLGFDVLDEYAKKLGVYGSWFMEKKFKSEIIKVYEPSTNNQELLLVKPATYMNNSGMAVVKLVEYFRIDPKEDLIIVHDELDLPLGKIKVRLGGAAAGHHGVESIINALGSDQFVRVRLGIGNLKAISGEHKQKHFNAEKFVLEPFMPNEHSKVKHMIKQATEALELLLNKGLDIAQNQFN